MSAICEELSCEEQRQSLETLLKGAIGKNGDGCNVLRVSAASSGSITPIEINEADAMAAVSGSSLTPGARYNIQLSGSNGGAAADVVSTVALATSLFSQHVDYFHNAEGAYLCVEGVFDATGWTLKESDDNAEILSTSRYNTGTNTFNITGYEVYGVHRIAIAGAEALDTITGGVEGGKFTIFVTGGGGNTLSVNQVDNIFPDANSHLSAAELTDNNRHFMSFIKRGSNWIEMDRNLA